MIKFEKRVDNKATIEYNIKAVTRQKQTNAVMAQVAEHVLGKDEVTGSNPVNSSKKSPHEH